MTSDVVLTAALRNNLLSLQKTQGLIDTTQLRLATGNKVNSALDNPQSFFAANALNNRAGDLQRLLDGIGQNIQVIKAADNGISALTSLIEQADSVAQSARDIVNQGSTEAKVTGDRDLSGITDITDLAGVANGDAINITVIDPEDDTAVTLNNAGVVTLNTGDSIEQIITQINDLNDDPSLEEPVIEASLDANGQLQIRTLNGGDLSVTYDAVAAGTSVDVALANDLGFGEIAKVNLDGVGAATATVSFTASANSSLTSYEFFDPAGDVAVASDVIATLEDSTGAALFGNFAAGDFIEITAGGDTLQINTGAATITIQGFIDAINEDASIGAKIEASFNSETGQISLRSIDAEVTEIKIGANDAAGTLQADFGFGTQALNAGATFSHEETIRFGASAAQLAQLETDFNSVLGQIDELVTNGDTGYRGTNLLNGDELVTYFNEFRSSTLTTEGVQFNAQGLGIAEPARFADAAQIDLKLAEVRTALDSVRNFGSSLANDLAVIQTRENFTTNLINTLEEGADKLTIADQNAEGAKLLALQTRQQLGVTSLALASQSQQSILRLF